VGMMGTIYKNAARVITYVGPAAGGEEKAGMDFMLRLYKHFEENYELLFEMGGLFEAKNRKSEFLVVDLLEDLRDDEHDDSQNYRNQKYADKYVVRGWRRMCEVPYGEWT
jgi:hypothetical protein